jgi:hypothetical protein
MVIANLATSAKKAPRLQLHLMNRLITGTNVPQVIFANLVSLLKNLVSLVSTILVWLREVAKYAQQASIVLLSQ